MAWWKTSAIDRTQPEPEITDYQDWWAIAEAISKEQDEARINELSRRLIIALDGRAAVRA